MATKTIRAASGHTMYVADITQEHFARELPEVDASRYTNFYIVRNWDANGCVFFYMAKGYHAPHCSTKKVASEVHVWYRKTKSMWTSMAYNFKDAIDGAARDGWLHA